MQSTVHIFTGLFGSDETGEAYVEYRTMEDVTRSLFADELGIELDGEHVLLNGGEDRYEALWQLIGDDAVAGRIMRETEDAADHIVYVFSEALRGVSATLKSTNKLVYHGEYPLGPDSWR